MTQYEVPLRVAVAGNVDASKSTFLGVLKSGEFDDGNGKARQCIFNYPHEKKSGRTSSVAQRSIMVKDKKIVFFDLAGHERYLRTTLFGMSSSYPNIALILVEGTRGVQKMTKEHIITALYLRIPMVIVLTKIDIAPDQKLRTNIAGIKKMMKKVGRTIFEVRKEDDIGFCVKSLGERFTPLFRISNVLGDKINPPFHYLVDFLSALNNRKAELHEEEKDCLFVIDKSFKAEGFPLIGSGYMRGGKINVGDKLKLGPYMGKYVEVTIRSLHDDNKNNVSFLRKDEMGCIAFKVKNDQIKHKKQIRSGMIVTNTEHEFIRKFVGKVKIFTHHSTTLKRGTNIVIHCGAVRRTVVITNIKNLKGEDVVVTRGGEDVYMTVRFLRGRHFVKKGDLFVFREGNTRGSGVIKELIFKQKDNKRSPPQKTPAESKVETTKT
jgi:GTPase